MDTPIPMEQKGARKMGEKFIAEHSEMTAEYDEQYGYLELVQYDAFISIEPEDLDKFRGYINRLVDGMNSKKFVEQNGDHEAPEDIYGAQGISDSVE